MQLLDLEDEEEDDDSLLLATMLLVNKRGRRRKHRWWVHGILKNRKKHGCFYHLIQELHSDAEQFHDYFRMSKDQFHQLLELVGPYLKKHSRMREVISPRERLAICIR